MMLNLKIYVGRLLSCLAFLLAILHGSEVYGSSPGSGSSPETKIDLYNQEKFNLFVAVKSQKFYSDVNETECIKLPNDGENRAVPKKSQTELEFTLIPHDMGWMRMWNLQPKKGVSPSTALKDLTIRHENPVVIGCETVISIAVLHCILEALTPKIFDAYFTKGFSIGHEVLGEFLSICEGKPIPRERGEIGYIKNITSYFYRHPHGSANGENVICTGKNARKEPQYIGLGALFKKGPQTLEQIYDDFKTEFLKEPTAKELKTIQEKNYSCPDYEQLKNCKDKQIWQDFFHKAQTSAGDNVAVINIEKIKEIRKKFKDA